MQGGGCSCSRQLHLGRRSRWKGEPLPFVDKEDGVAVASYVLGSSSWWGREVLSLGDKGVDVIQWTVDHRRSQDCGKEYNQVHSAVQSQARTKSRKQSRSREDAIACENTIIKGNQQRKSTKEVNKGN